MADNNQDSTERSSPQHDQQPRPSDHFDIARNNIRRRLDFGPSKIDDDLLQKLQGENQLKERQKVLEKWNFDFENGVPLPGDWEWEKVTADEEAPNATEVLSSLKNKPKDNRDV